MKFQIKYKNPDGSMPDAEILFETYATSLDKAAGDALVSEKVKLFFPHHSTDDDKEVAIRTEKAIIIFSYLFNLRNKGVKSK